MNIFRLLPVRTRTLLQGALLACAALAGQGVGRAAPAEVPVDSEIDALTADREFAAQALESGIRAAYERYLDEDAILFRPARVRAREWLDTHEPASGRLEWSPVVAETACDSSLAVTLGNWSYLPRDSKSAESGQYLTAWRRSEQGDWRIVLDQSVNLAVMPAGKAAAAGASGCEERLDGQKKLLVADRKQNSGLRTVRASDSTGVPIKAATAGSLLGSSRADLAVTHGELKDKRGARGSEPQVRAVYVRIWQRDGSSWRMLHEFVTPLPM